MQRLRFLLLLMVISSTTPTWAATDSSQSQLSEPLIKWMFTLGIVCIAVTWTSIPIIFAWQGKLDDLLDILRRGTVMRFVTVTYIVLVVVTLALVGRMDGDKVSTILASIAGYVLGQTTHSVHKEKGVEPDATEPEEGDQAS
jgi:hypothetical protein